MSKQMNIPQLRFPDFEGEWTKKKLGDFAQIMAGATPSTLIKEYWGGTIRWMNSGELNLKSVNEVENRITEKGLKNSSTKLLPKGCVLIGLAGQGKTRGTVAINMIELCTNQSIASILPNENYHSKYLYHNLDNRYDEMRSLSTGDGGRGGLNLQILRALSVSLPSRDEQIKLADFFSSIDEKLQALIKKKDLLEDYKKGVMQKLFSQELRVKDEDGKGFPDWDMKTGGDLFEAISNKKHNSDLPILAISQEFGAIPRELINYQISVTDKSVESYKVVDVGDFIISLRSFQGGIEYSNYKGICSPAYVILRNTKPIISAFYKYYFKTDHYIQKLGKKLEGIRDGKMISYKYFSEIELPYPSVQEQTKIAYYLSALDEKIKTVQEQIAQTENWKKGLLQKMFV